MPIARKLPSGTWRVRVYSHVDEKTGKQIYKSFTGKTKREAEEKGRAYEKEAAAKKNSDLTVGDALERYISAKDGVLSASTVRGYRQMQSKYYDSLRDESIFNVTTESLQRFVSSISGDVSAKTVSNVYGLLSAALAMFRPDAVFRVSLPKKAKPKKTSPSSSDVQALYADADKEMKICIALAAFGGLRRGEICGLKYGDVKNGSISVHADMVENEHNQFVYKELPKTADSIRSVRVPNEVIKLIGKGKKDDFIVKRTPNAVTHAFTRLRNRQKLDICFHDLRHYFASVGAVLGIPDNYLADFGGWRRGSGVMKQIYQNIMVEERDKYQNIMVDHFSFMTQNMTQTMTQKEKSPVNTGP